MVSRLLGFAAVIATAALVLGAGACQTTGRMSDPRALTRMPNSEVRRKLRHRLSIDLRDTPLVDCLRFIQTNTGVHVVLDPALRRRTDLCKSPVSLRRDDWPANGVLRVIVKSAGLEYAVSRGTVFVSTPDVVARKELENAVSFEFNEATLEEALRFLATLCRTTDIVLDVRVPWERKSIPITLHAEGMPLAEAFGHTTALAGLDYCLRGGSVFVSTPEAVAVEREHQRGGNGSASGVAPVHPLDRIVSLSFEQAALKLVLRALEDQTNVRLVVPYRLTEKRVSLSCEGVPLRAALDRLCGPTGLTYHHYGLQWNYIRFTARPEGANDSNTK